MTNLTSSNNRNSGFTKAPMQCNCLSCSVLPRDNLWLWGLLKADGRHILVLSVLRIKLQIFYSLFFFLPICSLILPSDFDCSDPLGMESGEITSDQIMASSQYNPSWSPERSRLNYYENAWTPADDSNKEWIQVQSCFSCQLLDTVTDKCS